MVKVRGVKSSKIEVQWCLCVSVCVGHLAVIVGRVDTDFKDVKQ